MVYLWNIGQLLIFFVRIFNNLERCLRYRVGWKKEGYKIVRVDGLLKNKIKYRGMIFKKKR